MIATSGIQSLGLLIAFAVAIGMVRDMLHRAKGKGRTGTILAALEIVVSTIMLAVFVYGLIFFVDAPIHPCAQSFCGKTGMPHTEADYRHFIVWQNTLIAAWALGVPTLIGLRIATR